MNKLIELIISTLVDSPLTAELTDATLGRSRRDDEDTEWYVEFSRNAAAAAALASQRLNR